MCNKQNLYYSTLYISRLGPLLFFLKKFNLRPVLLRAGGLYARPWALWITAGGSVELGREDDAETGGMVRDLRRGAVTGGGTRTKGEVLPTAAAHDTTA